MLRNYAGRVGETLYIIGLCGPAGSGKSAAAKQLSQREGISWVDLDKVAWRTYQPRSPTYWRLVTRFGTGILAPDGRIDRARLGRIVFSDRIALRDLNAIVHPAVSEQLKRIIDDQKGQGTKILLIEGALLGTSAYVDRSSFDAILYLSASEATRTKRLAAVDRKDHIQRGPQTPPPGAVKIAAEGTVQQVADRILAVIESS